MINADLVPYVVGMTKQSDRIGLIFHMVISIKKWLHAQDVRFFDIHKEMLKHDANEELVQTYVLQEPLNTSNLPITSSSVEGMDQTLEHKPETMTSMLVADGAIKRYIIPVGVDSEFKSAVVLDFTADCEEKSELIKLFLEMFGYLQETIKAKDQDPLTGLFNRRSFDETISQVLDEVSNNCQSNRVHGEGACLAIFDIDHFKKVNDVFGHAIGDEVLILFARLMEKMFRHGDKLYRFGGEEFLTILVAVDQEKALFALERFRKELEEFVFPQVGKVTVSIGSIMVNQDDYPSVLIEKADKALYYSKDNGRNQVNSHDVLVAEGKLANIEHMADDIEIW